MMTSIALFDLNSGSATYESFVVRNIKLVYSAHIIVVPLPLATYVHTFIWLLFTELIILWPG